MAERRWHALELTWAAPPDPDHIDLLLAELDADAPTAVEDLPRGVRVYFPTEDHRGRAAARVVGLHPLVQCRPIDVPDEGWAERSQAALTAVTIGGLVVAPPWDASHSSGVVIVIQPSMGFGTGHHASTRLCLELMQERPMTGAAVLDIGTGSGVLAIAAGYLGAARVVAVDADPDALQSARENLELNRLTCDVTVSEVDLLRDAATLGREAFDVVLANLTGGLLIRLAGTIAGLLAAGGTLIASGYTRDERAEVSAAFAIRGLTLTIERAAATADAAQNEEWIGATFTRPTPPTAS